MKQRRRRRRPCSRLPVSSGIWLITRPTRRQPEHLVLTPRLFDQVQIYALSLRLPFLDLESASVRQLRRDSQEVWHSIPWQLVQHEFAQTCDVQVLRHETLCQYDRRTSTSSVGVWHRDAVYVGFCDLIPASEHVRDLVCADVLTLPAERVAESIDKVYSSIGVCSVHISTPEPQVTLFKHIPHPPLIRRTLILEVPHKHHILHCLINSMKHLSRLTNITPHYPPILTPNHLFRIWINPTMHLPITHSMIPQRSPDANTRPSKISLVGIKRRTQPIRRSIQLMNDRDIKPFPKSFPHIRPHTIPPRDLHFMLLLQRMHRSIHQVPTQLAYVLQDIRATIRDFRPEGLVREFPAQSHRGASMDDWRCAEALRGAVVERETGVELVAWGELQMCGCAAGDVGSAAGDHHYAFGESRSAGGVNQGAGVAGFDALSAG